MLWPRVLENIFLGYALYNFAHHGGNNFHIIIDLAGEQTVPAEAKNNIHDDLEFYIRFQFSSIGSAFQGNQKLPSPIRQKS